MNAMNSVQLVCTPEIASRYYPEARAPYTRSILAPHFPITPENCATKLGRMLAEHISTTLRDDDASRCTLIMPVTEIGVHFTEMGKKLMTEKLIINETSAEGFFQLMEQFIADRRGEIAMYGDHVFHLRTMQFEWPVFGSKAAADAETPEAFFDLCGRQIRQLGGMILRLGLTATADDLPEGIMRTLSNGRGLDLLHRHRKHMIGVK